MSPDARFRLTSLLDALARRPRPVRVVYKRDHALQRAIGAVLRALTFGGQTTYLTEYVTTIGHTIYVPDGFDGWPPERAWEVLRHELVHVEQFERLTFPVMAVVYLFLPLPLGLAYGRARLEWEAYRETLRCVAELEGLAAARSPRLRDEIVQRFTGPDYGWMWPFPRTIRRWIAAALDEIEREAGASRPG